MRGAHRDEEAEEGLVRQPCAVGGMRPEVRVACRLSQLLTLTHVCVVFSSGVSRPAGSFCFFCQPNPIHRRKLAGTASLLTILGRGLDAQVQSRDDHDARRPARVHARVIRRRGVVVRCAARLHRRSPCRSCRPVCVQRGATCLCVRPLLDRSKLVTNVEQSNLCKVWYWHERRH